MKYKFELEKSVLKDKEKSQLWEEIKEFLEDEQGFKINKKNETFYEIETEMNLKKDDEFYFEKGIDYDCYLEIREDVIRLFYIFDNSSEIIINFGMVI